MPALYEKIKRQYTAKGIDYDKAQSIAAATYNKIKKTHPSMEKLSNKPEGETKKKKIRVKKK